MGASMSHEYVVQYNNGKYSCGPIALLNALRFQGHKATRRHLPWLARRLKSTGDGVYYPQFERIGRQMGVLKRLYNPSWGRVEDQLKSGNAVLIRLIMIQKKQHQTRYHSHFLVLTAIWIHGDDVSYYVANIGGRCKWTSRANMIKFYDRFYDDHWPSEAWTVPKQGKRLRLVS
jgi:hypothetical protein